MNNTQAKKAKHTKSNQNAKSYANKLKSQKKKERKEQYAKINALRALSNCTIEQPLNCTMVQPLNCTMELPLNCTMVLTSQEILNRFNAELRNFGDPDKAYRMKLPYNSYFKDGTDIQFKRYIKLLAQELYYWSSVDIHNVSHLNLEIIYHDDTNIYDINVSYDIINEFTKHLPYGEIAIFSGRQEYTIEIY